MARGRDVICAWSEGPCFHKSGGKCSSLTDKAHAQQKKLEFDDRCRDVHTRLLRDSSKLEVIGELTRKKYPRHPCSFRSWNTDYLAKFLKRTEFPPPRE